MTLRPVHGARTIRAGVAAAWLALGPPLSAQQAADPAGGDEPIEITSDRLVLEQEQQIAKFFGNVDAVQGDTTLRADELRVFYTSDEERQATGSQQSVKRLEADGNVIITQPGETAEGRSGIYDVVGGKMVLVGDVVLTRGQSVVKGDRLDVDRNTGVSVVTASRVPDGGVGGGAGQRVRALFVPEPAPPTQP
jgi:lipopolysaccharide export system protein LptA